MAFKIEVIKTWNVPTCTTLEQFEAFLSSTNDIKPDGKLIFQVDETEEQNGGLKEPLQLLLSRASVQNVEPHWRAICPKCLAEAVNGVCVEQCGQDQIETHAQWGNVYDLYHDLVEAL